MVAPVSVFGALIVHFETRGPNGPAITIAEFVSIRGSSMVARILTNSATSFECFKTDSRDCKCGSIKQVLCLSVCGLNGRNRSRSDVR